MTGAARSSLRTRLGRNAPAVAATVAAWVALAGLDLAPAATLTRGPYLQIGTSTGVTIRWRTSPASDSRIRYGLSPESLAGIADDTTSVTDHAVVLAGLWPETRYYYSVGSTTDTLAGGTSEYTFKTAPPPGMGRPTRVWIIGDSGQPGSNQQRVKNAFLTWTGNRFPDVWLMLGDNAYSSGTDSDYQAGMFDSYPEVLRKLVVWPTRGNHDGSTGYYGVFTLPTLGQAGGVPSGTEAYYSYDFGDIHFICLDSEGSSRSTTGAMANWLRSDLAATSREWVIAYWHHPPYSKGGHDSDSEGNLEDMRANFLPILEAGGADLALAGHSHSYERTYLLNGHYGKSSTLTGAMILDHGDGRTGPSGGGPYRKPERMIPNMGAVYAVAGSSSKTTSGSFDHPAMVISLYRLGSMVLDIDGNTMTARFLDDAGAVLDDFTMVKTPLLAWEVGTRSYRNRFPIKPRSLAPPPPSGNPGPAQEMEGTDRPMALRARPNPFFSPGAVFEYVLPTSGRAGLGVFGLDGRRLLQLMDRECPAGLHRLAWDGRGPQGGALPPGVYFAVLESRGEIRVHRLVRLQ